MRALLATTIAIAAICAAPLTARADEAWVTTTSERSVAEAVTALTQAIEKAGATVVATLDHSANAATAGLDLPETTVVIFGNPKIGTPLMQENRRIAIDLPQKILVWDENGSTTIGYVEPADLAARHGIDSEMKPLALMKNALDKLSSAAADGTQ